MNDKMIAVTGATGRQGGKVALRLLAQGWKVRALTRDVNKPAAKSLAEAGAEVVPGNLDNRSELDAAFAGVYGVFSVQNYWLPGIGYDGEIRQGKSVADTAKAAGVQHLVYSSVGAAHRGMGQKHFASKWVIEQYVASLGIPYTILRPVNQPGPQAARASAPDEEQIAMFNFFNGISYDADIAALRALYPGLQTLEQFLRRNGWENAQPIPIPEKSGWR